MYKFVPLNYPSTTLSFSVGKYTYLKCTIYRKQLGMLNIDDEDVHMTTGRGLDAADGR